MGLESAVEGGLAWDVRTSTMYGVQDAGTGRSLFTVDLNTGLATNVGNVTNNGDLSAIAFDGSGNLQILETDSSVMYTVDKSSAAILDTTPLSIAITTATGMAYDYASGTMYVIEGPPGDPNNNLYTLDVGTGAVTFVGSNTDVSRAAGLAIVPEPSAMVLFVVGGSLFLLRRRRKPI